MPAYTHIVLNANHSHAVAEHACQHTITLYCLPAHDHRLANINKKNIFRKSRIPSPCLCMQADNNTLELITSTKKMIIQTLSYEFTHHTTATITQLTLPSSSTINPVWTQSHAHTHLGTQWKPQRSNSHAFAYNHSSCTPSRTHIFSW